MKVLITGGMGVNGAVTARLMAQQGLRPVLLDNRMDLTLQAGEEQAKLLRLRHLGGEKAYWLRAGVHGGARRARLRGDARTPGTIVTKR